MRGKPGPKSTPRADVMRRFGLTLRQGVRAQRMKTQLQACKSNAARRLILGVSQKEEA